MNKHRVAIQHIALRWGKLERGAAQGALRNALPREAPFHPPSDNGEGWLQSIAFDAEGGTYRRSERWLELDRAKGLLPVRMRIEDGHLWIRLDLYIGQPVRPNLCDWIIRLPLGQRGIIHVNGKHDGHHQRSYHEHTVTVGFGETATLDIPLFREIDERVLLY